MSDASTRRKSIVALLSDLPHLLVTLLKEEFDQLKQELIGKLKHAGVGVGLFASAGVFAFFMVGLFLAAAVLGFATFLPGWLAALIVAGILLVISVVLALIGVAQVRKGAPPAPTETIKSVRQDVNAIKGVGKRESA